MAMTAVVTGDIGAGVAVSAQTITDVISIAFLPNAILQVVKSSQTIYYDVADQNTVTVTKSGSTYTVTIAA
jgi:hypothetical protein